MKLTKAIFTLSIVLILPLQGILLRLCGCELPHLLSTALAGLAIFGAAFILTWACELIQFDIPESLAIALVALIAVLPEYAVDIYFAWVAGKDPSYVSYATANMTGGNRLLIGLGWVAVLFAFWLKYRKKEIYLDKVHRIELLGLLAVTVYSFVIPIKGTISLIDSVVLIGIFVCYIITAARAHFVEPELEGGPAEVLSKLPKWWRRGIAISLFIISGWAIIASAEPFAEGLLEIGARFGIEKFILVQWIAPLASESPEFIVAILFALRMRPTAGLGTLVSSKVNQWALLVGMLPIAYVISSGQIQAMHIDARQVEEIFLTAAQSFFALAVIINLSFSLKEGLIIFLLFATQLFLPDPAVRWVYSFVYIALGIFTFTAFRSNRQGLFMVLKRDWKHK